MPAQSAQRVDLASILTLHAKDRSTKIRRVLAGTPVFNRARILRNLFAARNTLYKSSRQGALPLIPDHFLLELGVTVAITAKLGCSKCNLRRARIRAY